MPAIGVLQVDRPLRLLWAETWHAHGQGPCEGEGEEPVQRVAVRLEEEEGLAEEQPL